MARMTAERDAVVIRLVYDGPPLSGKTTSLRALAKGMARTVVSPEESDERTLYFDWLEYVGGSFDGMPIRCQILSVPGQRELAPRRRALLAEADAIVFVCEGSAAHLPATAEHLADLRSILAEWRHPRPGVVMQVNHRDRPGALPLAALRAALDFDGLAVVESVATESQGIREAFVLAVRLALDRARELRLLGILPIGAGETEAPAALLAWLKACEEGTAPSAPAEVLGAPPPASATPAAPATMAAGVALPPARRPLLPDSSAPSGRVWPPIDGRMLLHSATTPGAVPRLGRDGSWRVRSALWQFHSAAAHEFEHLDDAKQSLLLWAQRHTAGFERLSPHRCITLKETGWGTWRLWQIVRAEESLRQRLAVALCDADLPVAAERLRAVAARLLEARAAFRQPPPLPCRLAVIGERQGRPAYIGLLPPPTWEPAAGELEIPDAELVRREIQPLLEVTRGERRGSVAELLAELDRGHSDGATPPQAEALAAFLAPA